MILNLHVFLSPKFTRHILLPGIISGILFFSEKADAKRYDQDLPFEGVMAKWFSAWELVSDIYQLQLVKPVEFLLFDENYVYSTSSLSIQNGESVEGPNLMNLQLNWKRARHNGNLTLPDGTTISVGPAAFASENSKGGMPFFVMPLPSFWQSIGLKSEHMGLEDVVTGIFLHEFSHTQQMQNFGRKITFYEQENELTNEFDDDIVQRIFQKDPVFTEAYTKEIAFMYDLIDNNSYNVALLKRGLQLMDSRQNTFFAGSYSPLKDIEELFLTMEGLGQYTMYLWLTHPLGGALDRKIAITGVRRNKKWWSQDYGFALFLLLEQAENSKSWGKDMFGDHVVNVTDLLRGIIE